MRAIDLSLPAARRILDFGCGSGWVLAEAAKTGSPLCVGVDYSLKSLQGIGVPVQNDEAVTSDVHLVAGSGLSLPFANEVFDVVVMNPPFGALASGTKDQLTKAYPRSNSTVK